MAQIFHRRAKAVSRLSIHGALFIAVTIGYLFSCCQPIALFH
jgi:hypothetical protein